METEKIHGPHEPRYRWERLVYINSNKPKAYISFQSSLTDVNDVRWIRVPRRFLAITVVTGDTK